MQKLLLVALVIASGSLTACNTVQGFGEDMQSAGRVISGSVQK